VKSTLRVEAGNAHYELLLHWLTVNPSSPFGEQLDQCKPVEILFLDHTAVLSGAELSMLNLVRRLDRTRYAASVLLFADGPLAGALRDAGVAVEVLPLGDAVRGATRGSLGVGALAKLGAIFTSAAFVFRLARITRRHKPDIVHCNSLKADILGGFAARLAGVKIIWHIHDRIETDYLPTVVVKVFRFLLRHIPHYAIANSQGTLETLKLPEGKPCAVVYPGVPEGTARGDGLQVTGDRGGIGLRPDRAGDRRELKVERTGEIHHRGNGGKGGDFTDQELPTGIQNLEPGTWNTDRTAREVTGYGLQGTGLAGQPAGRGPAEVGPIKSAALPQVLISDQCSLVIEKARPPVVVLVGRISPWKGQDVFIRAAALVLKQFPACRFQIVGSALFGEDALEGELKQLAASLGIGEQIEFLGFRKDVPEIISAGTLVVHASTVPEPFGQVIVQAMAAGKPVVATRGGGVLEIVDDGVSGLLVPMKDADAMANAICEILSDPVRARKMGEAGRERFLERFTIEKTVEAVEGIYDLMSNEQYWRCGNAEPIPARRDRT
jgi:glycosyltransferase involved in cell wall biosynthesis